MKTDTLFTSKLLTKSTTLTIPAHASIVVTTGNINAILAEVLAREKEKENPEPWIDDDITDWFEDKTMPAIDQPFDSTIYRFNESMTHGSILNEAERTGIKKIYHFTEALMIALRGVLAGEVDEKGTGIIAYFKVDGNDQLYRFLAWRFDDGQLFVDVDKVYLGRWYDAGNGACFSNN